MKDPLYLADAPLQLRSAQEIIDYMESLYDADQRTQLMRFFKTGKGEYGEGDDFLGIKVPQTRKIVGLVDQDFPLDECTTLLQSRWHEVRLCALLILVAKFERLSKKRFVNDPDAIAKRDGLVNFYIAHAHRINNWDLVDLSAPKIIGHWLMLPSQIDDKRRVMDCLAASSNLWEQRISMVATWWPSHSGDPSWCLRYAEKHLLHRHDLMQKATGWMLREMGKHVSMELLRDFLRRHAHEMPRTTLRYAIEKMDDEERSMWMNFGKPARQL